MRRLLALGKSKVLLYGVLSIICIFFIVLNPLRVLEAATLLTVGIWLLLSARGFPEAYIYLLILAVTNIFGIFNILEDWRIPGVGKPSDFILVMMNIIVIAAFLSRKAELTKAEKRFLVIVLVLVVYMVFLVVYSSQLKGYETFNYALRSGAGYLYYSCFLFPLFLIKKPTQLYRFVNFLRVGGIVTGMIAVISNILGHSIVTGVVSADQSGFVRVYLPYFFNMFVLGLWVVQRSLKYSGRCRVFDVEMVVNALGIVLFLGRGLIVSAAVMVLLSLMIVKRRGSIGGTVARGLLIGGVALAIFFWAFNFSAVPIADRMVRGYTETMEGQGTFSARLIAQAQGFELFLRSPLIGTGFVHPTSSEYESLANAQGYAITNSADFGLGSILFTTGALGFLLVIWFLLAVLAYMWRRVRHMKEDDKLDFIYIYSLTVMVLTFVLFFVTQWTGNVFGDRSVAVELLPLAFAVRFLKDGKSPRTVTQE